MELSGLVRVSIGSAIKLGLLVGRIDVEPTTLYTMTYTSSRCNANCAFCAQARSSKAPSYKLSRVSWPIFPVEQVLDKLNKSENLFDRICIQALNYPGVDKDLLWFAEKFKAVSELPISISCQPLTADSVKAFSEVGVDRISIALDAASERLFSKVKGEDVGGPYTWTCHMQNLSMAVEIFGKGRVTTHLIVGLGETDKEVLGLTQKLTDTGVTPSLFAFTPIPGTRLEDRQPPSLARYRAIQLCHHLIVNRQMNANDVTYNDQGKIVAGRGLKEELKGISSIDRKAFMTSGCPGCNRPFYNERPLGPIYNYPRLPNEVELQEAINAVETYLS